MRPCTYDGTSRHHGSSGSAAPCGRLPLSASIVSSRNRDGTCSVLRRRSPRGKHIARGPAPRERREQRALIVADAVGALRHLTAEGVAVGVGQQRIVTGRRREHPFGQTAHPQPVELDAECERRGTHEHALTEPADAIAGGVELERERPAEHFERRVRLDRIEIAEPVDRGLDPAGRLLLECRPLRTAIVTPDPAGDEPVHPVASSDHVLGARVRSAASSLTKRPKPCARSRRYRAELDPSSPSPTRSVET